MKKYILSFLILTIVFFGGCYRGGRVETDLKNSNRPIVSTPLEFKSPLDEIDYSRKKAESLRQKLPSKIDFHSGAWKEYVGWEQAYETLQGEQYDAEDELADRGHINLTPGRSYTFILKSFCLHGGSYRPLRGDGFQVGNLSGKPKKWLPTILKNFHKLNVSQEKTQRLIWALLSDVRFDDLADEDQATLRKFYPDAPIRFGNRFIEEKALSFLDKLQPERVKEVTDEYQKMRDVITDYKGDYKDLEKVFAPFSARSKPLPVGWLQMKEGYFLKLTSDEDYKSIRVDMYVPSDSHTEPTFDPISLVALPETGQRLGISPEPKNDQRPKPEWDCQKVKKMAVNHCQPMTDAKRNEILDFADPKNFPKTRYVSPPDRTKSITEETDCSTFIYEIYKKAGYDYPFSTTSAIGCLNMFKEVPAKDQKPGDLILFPYHVGILDENGKVVSATTGGGNSKLPIDNENFKPSITRYSVNGLNMGPGKILQWTCPKE